MCYNRVYFGAYFGNYIGIMEKTTEATTVYWGYIGVMENLQLPKAAGPHGPQGRIRCMDTLG